MAKKPAKYWNNRVLATEYKRPDGTEEIYLQIHEVHYEEDKPASYTETPVTVGGETREEIATILRQMIYCLKKPILWAGDRWPQEYKP